jgi:hypothetical protein
MGKIHSLDKDFFSRWNKISTAEKSGLGWRIAMNAFRLCFTIAWMLFLLDLYSANPARKQGECLQGGAQILGLRSVPETDGTRIK